MARCSRRVASLLSAPGSAGRRTAPHDRAAAGRSSRPDRARQDLAWWRRRGTGPNPATRLGR